MFGEDKVIAAAIKSNGTWWKLEWVHHPHDICSQVEHVSASCGLHTNQEFDSAHRIEREEKEQ